MNTTYQKQVGITGQYKSDYCIFVLNKISTIFWCIDHQISQKIPTKWSKIVISAYEKQHPNYQYNHPLLMTIPLILSTTTTLARILYEIKANT